MGVSIVLAVFGLFMAMTRGAAAQSNESIVDVVRAAGADFGLLSEALDLSGLARTLDCQQDCVETYTLFAPPDSAFSLVPEKILRNVDYRLHLKKLFEYHLLPNRLYSSEFVTDQYYHTLQGEFVLARVSSDDITMNDAKLISTDRECVNGLVHNIAEVLRPPFLDRSVATIGMPVAWLFIQAFRDAGLSHLLEEDSITLFAPSDEAFSAFLHANNTSVTLSDVLLYHVVPSGIFLWDELLDGVQLDTALVDNMIDVTVLDDDQSIVLNHGLSGIAERWDVLGINGVMHLIDGVLLPPPPTTNLYELLLSKGLTGFAKAVEMTNLVTVLEGTDPMTLFVPSDNAMAALDPNMWNNTAELNSFVLYYLLREKRAIKVDDFGDGLYRTANRMSVAVDARRRGTRLVLNGDVAASEYDIMASNGVMHILEELLVPPSNLIETASVEGFDTFLRVVAAARLTETFEEEGPYTLFVPSEGAFSRMIPSALDLLLSDTQEARAFVAYHVLNGFLLFFDFVEGNYTTVAQRDFEMKYNHMADNSFTISINDAMVSNLDVVASNGCIHRITRVLT